MGSHVYVICGYAVSSLTNSIECLDSNKIEAGTAEWLRIKLPKTDLPPRVHLVAAALDDNKIVILGGFDGEHMKDVVFFDRRRM